MLFYRLCLRAFMLFIYFYTQSSVRKLSKNLLSDIFSFKRFISNTNQAINVSFSVYDTPLSGIPNSLIYFIYFSFFFIPEHVYHDVVLLSIAVDR